MKCCESDEPNIVKDPNGSFDAACFSHVRSKSRRRCRIGNGVRANDRRFRIVSSRFDPARCGAVSGDDVFEGNTLLHSGRYIKHPKNSNCQKSCKRQTSRIWRRCGDVPGTHKGNYYRRLFDFWRTIY